MLVETQLNMLLFFRDMVSKQVGELSEEQLLKMPDNISNNIVWNLGHVLFYESACLYAPAGQEQPVPESYGPLYKAGTSPSGWSETPDVAEVVERYKTQGAQSLADFKAGKFDDYKEMKLNDQLILNSLEEGLSFHLFHEGVHLGRILTLAKLI